MDLSVQIGSLTPQEPADCRERLLRLRRRVRRHRRPVVARRRRGQGAVPHRARRPPGAAHRRDAGRHAERDRPAGHRRRAASSTKSCRSCARRGATVIVNVCGTTLDEYVEVSRILSDAEGVARDRAEHLVPEHQGRRHPVRLQPERHLRRRQRGAQGDAAAGHSEADAERHRRRLVRARGRRSRRRRRVARQHVPRDGDRRRDAAAEDLERRRRPERPGDQPVYTDADEIRVPRVSTG